MSPKPRLLILCQLFYPELISTGQTVTELAESFVKSGWDIEVVAGPMTIMDRRSLYPRVMVKDGIRITRVRGTRFPKLSLVGKLINHISYTLSVFWYLLWHPVDRPIMVFTNPPFLPAACAVVSLFRPIKMHYVLFDLYPETAIQAGLLAPSSWIVSLWHRVNAFCFSRAKSIITIGRCMERVVRERLDPVHFHKLARIHVWADDATIQGNNSINFKHQWGCQNRIVLGYSGNLGRFHDFDTILGAAEQVITRPISFIFIGEGYSKALVQEKVALKGLKNFQFYSYVARESLGSVLSSFDVGVVSLKLGQEGYSVPSKTFGLMAAGKPIIAIMAADSEIGLIVSEAMCGWVIEPGDSDGLVNVLYQLTQLSSEELRTMGERGRKMLENRYTVGHAVEKLAEVINI